MVPDVTARPRSSSASLRLHVSRESGLSIDADDLGAQFLKDATEQDNFESELVPDLSITEGSASDAPISGAGASVWEQTVDRSSESDIREIIDPAISDATPAAPDEPKRSSRHTVDLLQPNVVDASLLDEQDEETGEVSSPEVISDEQDHYAHSPRRERP